MVSKMEVDEARDGAGDEKEESGDTRAEEKDETLKVEDPDAAILENLRAWCTQLEKGEMHVLPRMIQLLHKTRRQLNGNVLKKLITSQLAALPLIRDQLLSWFPPTATTTGLVQPVYIFFQFG
uniref:26S proteasome non-ATPase regulatory subunit 3 N-terminal TPR repeats domain-containing protein n=1 Tax=Setaria digitata TaxID=48799 RepID=A0A915PYT6_9BILA